MKEKRKKAVLAVLCAAVILLVLGAVLYPAFLRAREQARRACCGGYLKQIGSICHWYAQEYDGAFPSDFKSLAAFHPMDPYYYVCPSRGHEPGQIADVDEWTDYVILHTADSEGSGDTVLGYCKYHLKQYGETKILYDNGRVKWGSIDEETKTP